MDSSSEVIHHEMEDTRQDLTEKLETLEHQVMDTVQETTQAVTGTVEAVKETVETVKETVQDTVGSVKETVSETVESVRESLNLNRLVQEHPCMMFAAATAVGFVGGKLLSAGRRAEVPETYPSRMGFSSGAAPYEAVQDRYTEHEDEPSGGGRGWWSFITDHYSDELQKLKGLAVATVGNLVAGVIAEKATPELGQRAREIIDGMVSKLGGQPIEEPILSSSHGESEEEGPQHRGTSQEAFAT